MDEQHKKQAYQLANIGHWELDLVDKEYYWSDLKKHGLDVSLHIIEKYQKC